MHGRWGRGIHFLRGEGTHFLSGEGTESSENEGRRVNVSNPEENRKETQGPLQGINEPRG